MQDNGRWKGGVEIMAIKKSVWSMILKVAVAVVTAIAGVLGVNAMTLSTSFFKNKRLRIQLSMN